MIINSNALVNLSTPLSGITLENCDFIFLKKYNAKRSDVSPRFSGLEQGCPDTNLKIYIASPAPISFDVFLFLKPENALW